MKIKKAIILAAGYGKRLSPLTLKTPKPLIVIGKKTLLEKTIILLKKSGVNEIIVNSHHLSDKIKSFLKKKNFHVKIRISYEKKILDTGGGVLKASKFFKDKHFIVINPDTIWSKVYKDELKLLIKNYLKFRKPCLLLADKKLSFDKSFRGDFNLNKALIQKNKFNRFIFTGLQILNKDIFKNEKNKVFSMNKIWRNLIKNNLLIGIKSKKKFYHVNRIKIYKKLIKLKQTKYL
tara:strand:+ start:252 stop:953 length:702 start_codon:yes stop_codon:yes gene_type:complete